MMDFMTREMFKELFNLTDSDSGMEFADEEVENGSTYFEVAKRNIGTLKLNISTLAGLASK